MNFHYVIYTSLHRNFDPGVEGVTLDSIAETCPGYVDHTVPFTELTEIRLTLDRPIDGEPRDWIVEQLEGEFGSGFEKIVKSISVDNFIK